jgi:hypothetical protein
VSDANGVLHGRAPKQAVNDAEITAGVQRHRRGGGQLVQQLRKHGARGVQPEIRRGLTDMANYIRLLGGVGCEVTAAS